MGAERPTSAPPETKSSSEQPFAPPKTSISTEAASCIVGNETSSEQPFASSKTGISTEAVSRIVGNRNSRQPSPGRARKGRNPLAPRHPRGCRGAERPTPAPPETKSSSEQPFAPPKTSISTEAISCIVGNPNSRRTSPGRAREGRKPLTSRHPKGCRGAERPTLAPSETKFSSEQPFAPSGASISTEAASCIVGNETSSEQPFASPKTGISTEAVSCIVGNRDSRRSSPRESARGSQPSHIPSPEGV